MSHNLPWWRKGLFLIVWMEVEQLSTSACNTPPCKLKATILIVFEGEGNDLINLFFEYV
jgi:hypothetical protein